MAVQTITVNDFKRGDTPTFRFNFSDPYEGFDWTGITVDCAMTDVQAPEDNTGAAAVRLNQTITVGVDGVAYYEMTLTVTESKALDPGATYVVEAQLKQGGTLVVTPLTVKVKVVQDYII